MENRFTRKSPNRERGLSGKGSSPGKVAHLKGGSVGKKGINEKEGSLEKMAHWESGFTSKGTSPGKGGSERKGG